MRRCRRNPTLPAWALKVGRILDDSDRMKDTLQLIDFGLITSPCKYSGRKSSSLPFQLSRPALSEVHQRTVSR